MTTRSPLLLIIMAMAVLAPCANASAAASVDVTVDSTTATTPYTQGYSFALAYDTAPDRYTIEVIRPDGVWATPMTTTYVGARPSPVTGNGTFDLVDGSLTGTWTIRVSYYAQGRVDPEAVDQATFTVVARMAPPIAPPPIPQPQTITPQPVVPQQLLEPQSAYAPPSLVASLKPRSPRARAGRATTWVLAVRNSSRVEEAVAVRACVRLPDKTARRACASARVLAPGATLNSTFRVRAPMRLRGSRLKLTLTVTALSRDRRLAVPSVRATQSIR